MRHLKGKELDFREGIGSAERISILVGRHAQHGLSQTHTVSLIELDSGTSSDRHFHKEREESYYFLDGHGSATIDNYQINVEKGDLIHTFPNEEHIFTNTGDTKLKYLVITAPSWIPADSFKKTEQQEPSIFDPIHIDTKHVKIRPLQSVTWQKLAEDLLYENSFHALFWGVKTPEDMKKRYEDSISAFNSKKGNPVVFLNLDETEVLGMTNFMNVEPANKMIEIGGTWINKKYQRTYVNTETKLALLQYAFETLKLNRVEFRIDADNVASQKAVQRLGFHFDGLMPRRKVNANNDVRDYVFYSVTDQTWPTVKKLVQDLSEKYK